MTVNKDDIYSFFGKNLSSCKDTALVNKITWKYVINVHRFLIFLVSNSGMYNRCKVSHITGITWRAVTRSLVPTMWLFHSTAWLLKSRELKGRSLLLLCRALTYCMSVMLIKGQIYSIKLVKALRKVQKCNIMDAVNTACVRADTSESMHTRTHTHSEHMAWSLRMIWKQSNASLRHLWDMWDNM